MPKIIVTSRYIMPNAHKRFGNYIKYIATREGVAIPENKREIDREIFMNYLDSRPQSHGLFTGTDEKIVLDKAAKEVANHAGTVWTHIVSLRHEDAERMGFNTLDAWRDLVRRHVKDIAERLSVKMPSVNKAMNELKKLDLVIQEPYTGISLSPVGKKTAAKILARHFLLKAMLTKLGVSEKNANEDACKMEHILSQESLNAIDAFVHDEKKS